ncbi:MAG: hypothetical protein IJM92_05245 [Fibrobacter sp.]|uniref:hypothetical protein n=1 Tax=Fibrobacter sp. TaxID=35828 RepID=UPI0025BB5649|nr:hypothetical protein [Fibrobacter sp.]MBQ7079068.1 hypothetical protein [Fibrobacter sp.]
MSGTDKKNAKIADVQGAYLGFPNPYKAPPACKYDHRALVEYAKKIGKSINELTFEEKAVFVIDR